MGVPAEEHNFGIHRFFPFSLVARHHDVTSARAALRPVAGRDTLNGMETPGSETSAQVVPDTPEPVTPEPDMLEPDATQATSGPVWRFLVEPRWLGWHLFVILAFWGMLWLGDWQFRRAMAGNGLSWAYTFEWPLFAVFGIVFWARTVRDEFRIRRGVDLTADAIAESATVLPEGIGTRPIERPDEDADDAELASYNAYLAKLNAEVKGHNKWRR
jgi:hypothetical protein